MSISVSSVTFQLVCFCEGHFPNLQSHGWNNGTHGGRQLGSGNLAFLPLTMGPLLCYWPLCGHNGCSWGMLNGSFFHLPPHPPLPVPPHPTPPPIPPTPLLSILTAERDGKIPSNSAIQPSEIEKVSYNKNQ